MLQECIAVAVLFAVQPLSWISKACSCLAVPTSAGESFKKIQPIWFAGPGHSDSERVGIRAGGGSVRGLAHLHGNSSVSSFASGNSNTDKSSPRTAIKLCRKQCRLSREWGLAFPAVAVDLLWDSLTFCACLKPVWWHVGWETQALVSRMMHTFHTS